MFDINGERWEILLVSPAHPRLIRSDGSITVGTCDDIDKTIYIDFTLDETMLKRVLCHELTHAAMFSYNIDLDLMQEELLADLIATYGQEIIHMTNLLFKRIKENRGTH